MNAVRPTEKRRYLYWLEACLAEAKDLAPTGQRKSGLSLAQHHRTDRLTSSLGCMSIGRLVVVVVVVLVVVVQAVAEVDSESG